jgi:predicted phosphodiesterase
VPAPLIRIFSDLHFGDPRSILRNLASLTPLLAGADEIILNGDTVDTVAPETSADQAAVRAFFASVSPRVTFVSGNHDPDISALTELSLADERIWVTHGDVLFDHIAPWSPHAPELIRHLGDIAAESSTVELARIETRFHHHRRASHALLSDPDFYRKNPPGSPLRTLRNLFPPRRLMAILRAWRDTPRLAADLARRHRPRAQVVILGHIHRPGIWRPQHDPRITIINTGAFARPFGSVYVELQGEVIRVVRIKRRGDEFIAGRMLDEFTLAPGLRTEPGDA